MLLDPAHFQLYVERFNADDDECYVQHIPNSQAWDFLAANAPLFECPDTDFERTFIFRWWTYRKHIKRTPAGFVISEFLPEVPWAGLYNTISCAAGHHLYEGRWLRDPQYLDDYARFWFRGGDPRSYSFWAADACWARYLVQPASAFIVDLLDDLVANYAAWEATHQDPSGLFWQVDDRDGMEFGIGGTGYRPSINAYMYGDAAAIAKIADLAGSPELTADFRAKAERIKALVQDRLWDPGAGFFKTIRRDEGRHVDVRELIGYVPWYFGLPDPPFAMAWKQLLDPEGFHAAFGPTTAEQRHPDFRVAYKGHECLWNGPSWPYATSQALTGLASLLQSPGNAALGRRAYFEVLGNYTRSHCRQREDQRIVPWIDENLNPYTGDWISRTRLKTWENGTWSAGKGGRERGKDYNHSTYCDLVITGLVGLRPRADEVIEVNPLLPEGAWDYFCLDRVPYHGRLLTIAWDRWGERYGRGPGLRVYAEGEELGRRPDLGRLWIGL